MKDYFAMLVLAALTAGITWFIGGGIYGDLTVDKDSLRPSFDYTIEKAECETRLALLATCNIGVKSTSTGEETQFDYMIASSMDGETVDILVDPNSGYVTTSIGMNYMTNRVIFFGVLILLFGGGFAALLMKKLRGA